MKSSSNTNSLIEAVKQASEKWQAAFNQGNAKGCAEAYEKGAVMNAEPFGHFEGHEQIEGFWQNLIEHGYKDVHYIEPRIEAVDETSAILTSHWTMNQAEGEITKELWVLQNDGTAKLRLDEFEAKSE